MSDVAEELKQIVSNPYYVLLLAVLGVAAFLRFQYAFFDGMLVDEGRYARTGIELSRHLLDYSVTEQWHGQITGYPPVYPYLIALSTYLFGRTELAVRVVSPVIGVATVGLTYFLGREMDDRNVGIIAAALLALNPVFWFLSERILIGATFTLVYSAAIFALYYGLEDRKYSRYALWSLGPLVALNIMTKQPAYTLGLVIPLYFVSRKRGELKKFIVDGESFRNSGLYETVTDRDYYVSALLGAATLAPWMLRNLKVCGVPLCGLSRALKFAGKSTDPLLTSVQDTFFYIFQSPAVLTLPVAALVAGRIAYYLLEESEKDEDMLVKKATVALVATGLTFVLIKRLVPMVLLTSIALFARRDSEKLLWIWTGIGVGFMSIPGIKLPRYVVFTVPALVTLAGMSIRDLATWLSSSLDRESLSPEIIAAAILVPVLVLSYLQGAPRAASGGFAHAEPAGEWLSQNTPEDASFAASSPAIMRYYVYPRMAYRFPGNESEFLSFAREKDIRYVEVDIYERTQPEWVQTSIPPYRIPNSLRAKLVNRQISRQDALKRFEKPPSYLEPVKSFGRTKMQLTGREQPVLTIYRINRSKLE